MFKKYIFFVSFICVFQSVSFAQFKTGGNIGINVVNNILIVDLSPECIYSFDNNISFGISPIILYSQHMQTNVNKTVLGLRMLGEYKFDQGIFLHAEYEMNSQYTSQGWKSMAPAAPIGGGFEREITASTVAYGMILYDILYNPEKSIRQNPIVRAGVRYAFD